MLLLGAQSVGEVAPSGVWAPDEVRATIDFDQLDHEYWNEWLLNSVTERGLGASGEAAGDAEAVWEKRYTRGARTFVQSKLSNKQQQQHRPLAAPALEVLQHVNC